MSGGGAPERKTSAAGRPSLFRSTAPARVEEPPAVAVRGDEERAGRIPAKRAAVRGRQDRSDKRQVAGFFSPECAKQLRMLAAEQDTTVQELIRQGLNAVFHKHGKPPIA